MPNTIRDGHAVVTGASSGLGRELVRQLVSDRGMTVLATARRLDRLESLAAELHPGRVIPMAGDLEDAGFRQALWQRALALPGGVDLLVNNAGVGHYAEFAEQDPARIRQIIEINLMALIDLSQKAARHMKERGGGQILQVSSVLGFVGIAESAVYVASKHAVNGLVKSLRYELAGTGIRVWAACPGRTVSEFSEVAGRGAAKAPSWPGREPTERVVRGIVRGLDGGRAFVLPTWRAWLVVTLASWLPGPIDWLITRLGPGASRGRKVSPTSAP
jgi:short-subunit dehydrogenase